MRTIEHTGGGPFIGNPITFSIPAINLYGRDDIDLSKVSFHCVVMTVEINGTSYEMSQSVPYEPVSGEAINMEFDISSAFRSAAESQHYQPITTSEQEFAIYRAIIQAHDKWVYDGVLVDNQGVAQIVTIEAIAGAFSDYERLCKAQTATSSRKPATGEIVYVGDVYVYGGLYGKKQINHDVFIDCLLPRSFSVPITAAMSDTVQHIDTRDIYVHNPSASERRTSRLFQFVNSRGVIESIRTFQLAKEDFATESENIVISRPETFRNFSRRVLRKNASTLSLTYSSGFCDYAWALWWMDEFCMSNHHWMLTPDGIWLPCSVKIDDKATLLDSTKHDMSYVQFTVTPDIHGALW